MPRGPVASAGRRPRSNMKLNPEDLAKITDFTLSHYNEHAEDFWEGAITTSTRTPLRGYKASRVSQFIPQSSRKSSPTARRPSIRLTVLVTTLYASPV